MHQLSEHNSTLQTIIFAREIDLIMHDRKFNSCILAKDSAPEMLLHIVNIKETVFGIERITADSLLSLIEVGHISIRVYHQIAAEPIHHSQAVAALKV